MAQKFPVFVGSQPIDGSICTGLPQFKWEELRDKEEIGKGSFGVVFTARCCGEVVVIKKLMRQNDYEKRLFLKEATILNGLSNGHIVQLKAVCSRPFAMMLEYLYFDLGPFVITGKRLSSLNRRRNIPVASVIKL